MARSPFSAHRDGSVGVRLPAALRQVLRAQLRELDRLLTTAADTATDTATDGPADPLEALTGMTGPAADRPTPDDPALARLRPEAYAGDVDDGRAAAEYRRLAGGELEALQRGRVALVLETLDGRDRFDLTAAEAQAWVGALNDLRLALGTRLGMSDDTDELPDGPETYLYQLLTALQGELLLALGAPRDL